MRLATLKSTSASVLIGFGLAAAIGIATGAANRPPAPAPIEAPRTAPAPVAPVIAIVDITKVMESMDERKEGRAEIEKRMTDLQAEAKKADGEAKAEEDKIKLMTAGPAKTKAIKAYRDKTFRSNVEIEYSGRVIAEERAAMLRDSYLKIDEAAARLAKANGYQIVLSSDEKMQIPLPPAAKFDDISQVIAIKRMLYVDPALDISDELITMLNNEFHTGAVTPPPAPAKPKK